MLCLRENKECIFFTFLFKLMNTEQQRPKYDRMIKRFKSIFHNCASKGFANMMPVGKD